MGTHRTSLCVEALFPQSRDELASRGYVANRIDALAYVRHQLSKRAAIAGLRSKCAVTKFRSASRGVRGEDVALARTLTRRWASRGFPHLERLITQRTMRRVCPFVLKADGQHRVGGFGPSDGVLVIVVRSGLLGRGKASTY